MTQNSQPILPRYPWQEQRKRWLKLMIKTKKALEEAEKKAFNLALPNKEHD